MPENELHTYVAAGHGTGKGSSHADGRNGAKTQHVRGIMSAQIRIERRFTVLYAAHGMHPFIHQRIMYGHLMTGTFAYVPASYIAVVLVCLL